MDNKDFEKAPEIIKSERIISPEQDFAKSFSNGVPELARGAVFASNLNPREAANGEELNFNESVSDAASLLNYGLDAVTREKGVEYVVQGIKTFNAVGSDNPLRDLLQQLGLNNLEELQMVSDESAATKQIRNSFKNEFNMPRSQNKSREGIVKAIDDMKELISEVEGADPRYSELRKAAKSAGKGYFEYAVQDFDTRGLTELFSVLIKQKESSGDKKPGQDTPALEEEKPQSEEEKKEEGEDKKEGETKPEDEPLLEEKEEESQSKKEPRLKPEDEPLSKEEDQDPILKGAKI